MAKEAERTAGKCCEAAPSVAEEACSTDATLHKARACYERVYLRDVRREKRYPSYVAGEGHRLSRAGLPCDEGGGMKGPRRDDEDLSVRQRDQTSSIRTTCRSGRASAIITAPASGTSHSTGRSSRPDPRRLLTPRRDIDRLDGRFVQGRLSPGQRILFIPLKAPELRREDGGGPKLQAKQGAT